MDVSDQSIVLLGLCGLISGFGEDRNAACCCCGINTDRDIEEEDKGNAECRLRFLCIDAVSAFCLLADCIALMLPRSWNRWNCGSWMLTLSIWVSLLKKRWAGSGRKKGLLAIGIWERMSVCVTVGLNWKTWWARGLIELLKEWVANV
ncbi:hypothetical protein KY290_022287 [Solanum tuberosum]|uniref:Uncharacterized protein n=1 Tax=Solanum tuberosum TaxID=4113 RepID=A0ABQ7V3V8_SOLTU|nr:hypothetical protein KY289_021415 [Solanum tuberosum]KAH0758794.1 hypothetical protein KY290_022287 [Solanum tuberosum]